MMTHGTDHDAPAGDAADGVPGQGPDGSGREGVPQPHTPPAGESVTPEQDTTPTDATPTDAPASDAASEPAVPAAPAPAGRTSWPSWGDVAVTAPSAAERPADAGAASDEAGSNEPAGTTRSAAAQAEEPAAASPAPDAGRGRGATLPPLSLSGLSELAYTALNAATAGVPAHALASSRLPASTPQGADGGQDAPAAAGEPGTADVDAAGGAEADAPQAPAAGPHGEAAGTHGEQGEPGDATQAAHVEPAADAAVTADGTDTAVPAEDASAVEDDATVADVQGTDAAAGDATAAGAEGADVEETDDVGADSVTDVDEADAPVTGVDEADAPVTGVDEADAPVAGVDEADAPVAGADEADAPVTVADDADAVDVDTTDADPATEAEGAAAVADPGDPEAAPDEGDATGPQGRATEPDTDARPDEETERTAATAGPAEVPGTEVPVVAAPPTGEDAPGAEPEATSTTDVTEAGPDAGPDASTAGSESAEPESAETEPESAEPAAGEAEADAESSTEVVPVAGSTEIVAAAGATAVLPAGEVDEETRANPVVLPPAWSQERAAAPVGPASPLDVFEEEQSVRRWPRVLAIVGGAVGLLAVGYVGSAYALADRVPRGATVAGVEIGSMSTAEAEQALSDGLAGLTTAPVPVVAQDVQAELDPVAAGLTLDAEATVARLTGVDLAQPVRVWWHIAGVGEQPPVTTVDEPALTDALKQLGGSLVREPVDGTVVFADGEAHATDAVDGWELDAPAAAAVLQDGWLTAPRPVELPTAVVAPAVTQEETDRALAELAKPLAAAPVTVVVGDRQAALDVPTLTANAAVAPVDGRLELQVDGAALSENVLAQLPDLLTPAADARFEFQEGAPVIVPGTPGTTLDPQALAQAVVTAATEGDGRVATVELVSSDPAQTTQALEALGVKEIVSEFSTPLTSERRRTANIANGLAKINGTLVRPGETFSLTEALGPVDGAHGFVQAGAIVNGEHRDAWGGGLSQVSTTAYNAAYFAGFEDVEHTPHSEWFRRYPEGREATIYTGSIDMKWKNNTPYGALVQGFVADGRATVRIWSTKHFTVETEKSGRSGVVAPTTVYSQSRTCQPQSAGNPGFTVTNTRRVYLDGELVDTTSRTWRYKPQNKVVCGSPPEATPAAPAP